MVDDTLTAEFEASRPRLRALAYRMLGSQSEADDAVQEAWLRLHRTNADTIDNLGGWLTTVIARLCLDRLRSRSSRREDLVGEQLSDDLIAVAPDDPAREAEMADSIGAALLVVLDVLPPAERVAFVLHDVFAVPFDVIAEVLDRSSDATRQLASRARRRLQESSRTAGIDLVLQRTLVDTFLRAARGGDFEALLQVLHPDVVLRPDAAALQMGSLRELHGAADVANALSGGARVAQRVLVDGVTALAWAPGGQIRGVIEFVVSDGRIIELRVTGDAERIAQFDIVPLDD